MFGQVDAAILSTIKRLFSLLEPKKTRLVSWYQEFSQWIGDKQHWHRRWYAWPVYGLFVLLSAQVSYPYQLLQDVGLLDKTNEALYKLHRSILGALWYRRNYAMRVLTFVPLALYGMLYGVALLLRLIVSAVAALVMLVLWFLVDKVALAYPKLFGNISVIVSFVKKDGYWRSLSTKQWLIIAAVVIPLTVLIAAAWYGTFFAMKIMLFQSTFAPLVFLLAIGSFVMVIIAELVMNTFFNTQHKALWIKHYLDKLRQHRNLAYVAHKAESARNGIGDPNDAALDQQLPRTMDEDVAIIATSLNLLPILISSIFSMSFGLWGLAVLPAMAHPMLIAAIVSSIVLHPIRATLQSSIQEAQAELFDAESGVQKEAIAMDRGFMSINMSHRGAEQAGGFIQDLFSKIKNGCAEIANQVMRNTILLFPLRAKSFFSLINSLYFFLPQLFFVPLLYTGVISFPAFIATGFLYGFFVIAFGYWYDLFSGKYVNPMKRVNRFVKHAEDSCDMRYVGIEHQPNPDARELSISLQRSISQHGKTFSPHEVALQWGALNLLEGISGGGKSTFFKLLLGKGVDDGQPVSAAMPVAFDVEYDTGGGGGGGGGKPTESTAALGEGAPILIQGIDQDGVFSIAQKPPTPHISLYEYFFGTEGHQIDEIAWVNQWGHEVGLFEEGDVFNKPRERDGKCWMDLMADELSGGQKQKIGILRLLVRLQRYVWQRLGSQNPDISGRVTRLRGALARLCAFQAGDDEEGGGITDPAIRQSLLDRNPQKIIDNIFTLVQQSKLDCPILLVADEIFSEIDGGSRNRILPFLEGFLRARASRHTYLMAAHDDVARFAKHYNGGIRHWTLAQNEDGHMHARHKTDEDTQQRQGMGALADGALAFVRDFRLNLQVGRGVPAGAVGPVKSNGIFDFFKENLLNWPAALSFVAFILALGGYFWLASFLALPFAFSLYVVPLLIALSIAPLRSFTSPRSLLLVQLCLFVYAAVILYYAVLVRAAAFVALPAFSMQALVFLAMPYALFFLVSSLLMGMVSSKSSVQWLDYLQEKVLYGGDNTSLLKVKAFTGSRERAYQALNDQYSRIASTDPREATNLLGKGILWLFSFVKIGICSKFLFSMMNQVTLFSTVVIPHPLLLLPVAFFALLGPVEYLCSILTRKLMFVRDRALTLMRTAIGQSTKDMGSIEMTRDAAADNAKHVEEACQKGFEQRDHFIGKSQLFDTIKSIISLPSAALALLLLYMLSLKLITFLQFFYVLVFAWPMLRKSLSDLGGFFAEPAFNAIKRLGLYFKGQFEAICAHWRVPQVVANIDDLPPGFNEGDDVLLRFDGVKWHKRSMSFDVNLRPGLNVLIGENGVGKSTVLEAMAALSYGSNADDGSIQVVGGGLRAEGAGHALPIRGLPQHHYVPGDLPCNAYVMGSSDHALSDEWLAIVCIDGGEQWVPDQVGAQYKAMDAFSGGQKARLGLLRYLRCIVQDQEEGVLPMHNGKVIIPMDELFRGVGADMECILLANVTAFLEARGLTPYYLVTGHRQGHADAEAVYTIDLQKVRDDAGQERRDDDGNLFITVAPVPLIGA